jgi:ABC-type Zn uptake system ZnuABC Zn-binding protein ZnuA
VVIMVDQVRAALVAADPTHQSDYEANAAAYTTDLLALEAWVSEQTQTLPAGRRKLVTTHDTLAYFAERYDFQVLGTVLPATTEGASPSAQALAGLVEAVRAAGVPAVFAENVSSNSLINQVATEAGVRVVASLYTDALGPEGSGAESYVGMMRQNVNTIVTALGR